MPIKTGKAMKAAVKDHFQECTSLKLIGFD